MKCAVVILNWNGKHYLEQFLPSVAKHTKHADIIVADNASTDNSIEFLKSNYPDIQLIKNDNNYGFAKGYNVALQQIKGKYNYYILLNSDVEVTESWEKPLIEQLKKGAAACQPEIRSFRAKDSYEYAGAAGGFIDKNGYPFCRGRIFIAIENINSNYNTEQEIFWASGACFAVKSDIFHDFGGFDEEFYAHMEEIDLCWRMKNQGHKVVYTPYSTVYHLGGGSLQYGSPFKTYLNHRNNLMMLVKNYHQSNVFIKVLKRLILDGLAGIRFLILGQFKLFFSVFKAHFAFYASLSSTLRKRKQNKPKRNVNKAGWYKGSLVWDYFIGGKKKFSDLSQEAFER